MQIDWLKYKKYPHIGLPLSPLKDTDWVVKYVTNPDCVTTHKFVPLLRRNITQRKFRPVVPSVKNPSGKRFRMALKPKVREIYYASHLDSIVYSYYNNLLVNAYEDYLSDKPYASVPVAYRKIAIDEDKKNNKCNIEFAKEAFDFILQNKHRKLSVIVADVTSFFDNLNHRLLHRQWKKVLNVDDLPADHYTIYKNIVHFSYVNENELYKRFRDKLIVWRYGLPKKLNKQGKQRLSRELKNKKVKHKPHFRDENVLAYCTKKDFFKYAKDLIRFDKPYNHSLRDKQGKEGRKGIPQGTPISATLANIYMLDFDEKVYSAISDSSKNGYYQRYSDDIIIICDQKDELFFSQLIQKEIEEIAKLEIQPSKTHIYHYELSEAGILQGGMVENGTLNKNKQLEYLGFRFDGQKVLVKTQSFSKFYRRMKRSFRRGAHFATKEKSSHHTLFEWRLYKKYTHLGAQRRLKWMRSKKDPKKFERSEVYDWGNFISYLNKANEVMKSINNDDSIQRQYRKVWNNFGCIKKKIYLEIEDIVQQYINSKK